jgi:Uma2 family endonuclease
MTGPATSTRLTPDDLFRMPDGGRGYELVDGEPREIPMSVKSNIIGGEVFYWVKMAAKTAGGDAFPPESGFRCFAKDPTRVRKPDTAYVAPGRLTDQQYDEDGFCSIVPDLVAEVVSPNDLAYAVNEKLEEWLAAGARLVWIIHPDHKTVDVYSKGASRRLREGETLTADPVLPGFAVPVKDLLARAGSMRKPG